MGGQGGLLQLAIPAWQIVVRTVIIYLVLLLGLRVFGKREIGQFTTFDLILIVLVSNAVQPAITGPDTSLTGGVLIIGTLLVVNLGVDWAKERWPMAREIIEGHPTVIALDGQWLEDTMRREGVDTDEASMALREHGLQSIQQVKVAVLEIDGSISFITRDNEVRHRRRRVRYIRR